MSRYGYSDVSQHTVKAECPDCGRRWIADREQAWRNNEGSWLADDGCSESDEEHPRPIENQW